MSQIDVIGLSLEDIISLYLSRKSEKGPEIERMRRVRDGYNGDLIVPLPEMDRTEESFVANIIQNGLDQTAMRIASTLPSVYYPPVEYGDNASEKRARTRTRANMGWWETNDMNLKLRLRSRKLIGYASSPVSMRPDMKKGCAKWMLRDPLSSYPSTVDDASDLTPSDCIFAYERRGGWIQAQYPQAMEKLDPFARHRSPDEKFTIIEYQDAEVTVMAVLANEDKAPVQNPIFGNEAPRRQGPPFIELERVRNRTGLCLVVHPGRMTLDRQSGAYDGLVGIVTMMAKLQALEVIHATKSVFPDKYLVSRPNEIADFTSGPWQASSGMVNIVTGGEMREIAVPPSYTGSQTIDRLERNARINGGIASEMGGESQTNVRTGRRGDAILSAVVDFPVQEAQEILERSLEHENNRAVAIAKSYFGNEKRSFYISSLGKQGHVDYTPNKDFETDHNIVKYPYAGADANGLTVQGGQKVAMETMSKWTFMNIDPSIEDPQQELDRINQEQMLSAILAGFNQKLQTGEIPIADGARVMQLVVTDKQSPQDAILMVQKEAQARQATPVPAGAPETQPGLSMPGMGAEQPTIQPPPQASGNLATALQQLRVNSKGA